MADGGDQPLSPLCIAARDGDIEIMQKLISEPHSHVYLNGRRGEASPLYYAVKGGHVSCVELLLNQAGIDVHKTNPQGLTELHTAAVTTQQNTLPIIKLLLDAGADVTTAFYYTCEHGSKSVVEFLFNEKKNTLLRGNRWYKTYGLLPHFSAAYNRYSEVLEFLFDVDCRFDVDVNYSDKEKCDIVGYAAQHHDCKLMQNMLLRYGSTILRTEFSHTLLETAVEYSIECLRHLLDQGLQSYQVWREMGRGWFIPLSNVITFAVRNQNIHEAQVMLAESLNIDDVKRYDRWFLSNVIIDRPTDCCHPLQAAILQISDRRELNPIVDEATWEAFDRDEPQFRFLTALLRSGFDPNALRYRVTQHTTNPVDFPLRFFKSLSHYLGASYNVIGHAIISTLRASALIELVRILIQFGANVNATGDGEISPLTALALAGRCDHTTKTVCDMLLAAGADLTHRRANSRFQCSDVAVAAALTGNTVILSMIVGKIGLNPVFLLDDLIKFTFVPVHYSTPSGQNLAVSDESVAVTEVNPTVEQNVVQILAPMYVSDRFNLQAATNMAVRVLVNVRHTVELSLLFLINYSTGSPGVLRLCERIDHILRVQGADIDESSLLDFYRKFETVKPLQHLCRVRIIEQLSTLDVSANIQESIARTPLPPVLRQYLSFADEIARTPFDMTVPAAETRSFACSRRPWFPDSDSDSD